MVLETRLYERLQVYSGATQEKIAQQFRKLNKELQKHPDKNNGETNSGYNELTEAYNILKDPVTRRIYDEQGMRGIRYMNQYHNEDISPPDAIDEVERIDTEIQEISNRSDAEMIPGYDDNDTRDNSPDDSRIGFISWKKITEGTKHIWSEHKTAILLIVAATIVVGVLITLSVLPSKEGSLLTQTPMSPLNIIPEDIPSYNNTIV